MRVSSDCEACLYNRQKNRVSVITDPKKRSEYLDGVREILRTRDAGDSSPFMVYRFNSLYRSMFGTAPDFSGVKKEYNDLALSIEQQAYDMIKGSSDPLKTALIYSRKGNYIDFGAMASVDKEVFIELLNKDDSLDEDTYRAFCDECTGAESFLLLCDNCGEIVFDKLLLRVLRERFGGMKLYAMVRGGDVLNDVTKEDAAYTGLDKVAEIITNGRAISGVVPYMLGAEEKRIFDNADVVLSKGQGNYEALSGYRKKIYYSFLCKCSMFTERFSVPPLTGMFIKE